VKDFGEFAEKLFISRDLLRHFWRGPWWWLTPFVVLLVAYGLLCFFTSAPTIYQFIYTLS